MNNNNNLGLDQPMAPNPQLQTTDDYLLNDVRKPKDNSFPALNKQPYQPDIETQVIDANHPLNQGVYSPYNVESTEQWEARVARANRQAIKGRTVYNTPVTQTPSIAPNVDDGVRPTEDQLTLLRKRDRLANALNRLKSLQLDEQRTALKLKGIKEAIKNLQTEVEDL